MVLARGRAQAGARAPLHPLTRRRHAASLGPHAGRVRLIEMTLRRALLRRFPYAIFFKDGESNIIVFAVLHQARDVTPLAERTR